MAIILNIKIYGFGSFFSGSEIFNDIDLLIVHKSNSYDSCLEAITLKREIQTHINNVDITMLSESEEFQFKFIEKASATYLCSCETKGKIEIVNYLKLKLQSFQRT